MKVLVVDDDLELSTLLGFTLEKAGFDVVTAPDAEAAFAKWQSAQPSVILLDVSMPRRSGLYFLERLRRVSTIPVIMLTARTSDEDVVRAFDLGADDYVTKPFSPRQLIARVRAALRRAGVTERQELKVGRVRLDLAQHQVQVGEAEPTHLTPLELKLLEVLMDAPSQPLAPDRLIEQVWGYEGHLTDHALLKSLVRRVRRKIEPDPREPRYIKTVLGVGYTFVPAAE
jgi:DNA-binding response OmpR family regulator